MDVEGLVEALRKPLDCEATLQQWDQWRRWIKEGRGSLPRDAFEAFLSCVDEERTEAAEALSRQKAAGDAMAEALAMLTCGKPQSLAAMDAALVSGASALTAWNSIEQGDEG